MPASDFIAFGTAPSANVDSQATYAARANNLGYPAGSIAGSSWVNKATRQATFVSAGVAQFMLNQLSIDILDDGDVPGFAVDLKNAILAVVASVSSGVVSFNGRAGAVNLTNGDVLTALGGTPIFVGGGAGGALTGTWPNPGLALNIVGTTNLQANSVTNAKLAQMASNTIKANLTGALANAADFTIAQLLTALGVVSSFAATGYISLFGFTIQWTTTGAVAENMGIQTTVWPIAFPTACVGFAAQVVNPTGTTTADWQVWSQVVDWSRTQGRWVANATDKPDRAFPFFLLAIGY